MAVESTNRKKSITITQEGFKVKVRYDPTPTETIINPRVLIVEVTFTGDVLDLFHIESQAPSLLVALGYCFRPHIHITPIRLYSNERTHRVSFTILPKDFIHHDEVTGKVQAVIDRYSKAPNPLNVTP